jgi:hypothetical protein
MIKVGHDKVITISALPHDYKPDGVKLYWSGMDPIYNPVVVTRGEPETMKELASKLEEILGVGVCLK